jgi:hypothetical protein
VAIPKNKETINAIIFLIKLHRHIVGNNPTKRLIKEQHFTKHPQKRHFEWMVRREEYKN